MTTLSRRAVALAAAFLLLLAACSAAPPAEVDPHEAPGPTTDVAAARVGADSAPEPIAIPVSPEDPTVGDSDALVTLVVFSDFECPHCRDAAPVVRQLSREYAPSELRVVYKSFPLERHSHARSAAEVGAAIHALAGNEAWLVYHDAVFGADDDEPMETSIARGVFEAAKGGALTPESIGRTIASSGAAKVDADLGLAERLGVSSTPTFFVNGLRLRGSAPLAAFKQVVDAELAASKALVDKGTPRSGVYAARLLANVAPPDPKADEPAAPPPIPPQDPTVWKVPVDGSPVLGKSDAAVTLVVFADYECPFCARLEPTLHALREKYGDDLRIVWKNDPLPRHRNAEPAAELALAIRKAKGDAAFWRAHDALFARDGALGDQAFSEIATDAGLDPKRVLAEVAAKKHEKTIAADVLLADDMDVSSTPQVFVNGRRVVGAQPLAVFVDRVDTALAEAKAKVAAGIPRAKLYESLIADGASTWPPPKVDEVSVGTDVPVRGPKDAPITIQVFGDFQCPFCARHHATLAALEKKMSGKIRIVWRNVPLSRHDLARPAATVALELRREKGDKAFWKLADDLFAHQDDWDGATLFDRAAALGGDPKELHAAVDQGRFDKALEADRDIARTIGVSGTPTTLIGRYVLSGAVPLETMERAITLIRSERKGTPAKRPAK
jgi:protein-disulfide isomerase